MAVSQAAPRTIGIGGRTFGGIGYRWLKCLLFGYSMPENVKWQSGATRLQYRCETAGRRISLRSACGKRPKRNPSQTYWRNLVVVPW